MHQGVEQLNIKAKFWKDLLTDESFTRKDIIHLQDPQNLEVRLVQGCVLSTLPCLHFRLGKVRFAFTETGWGARIGQAHCLARDFLSAQSYNLACAVLCFRQAGCLAYSAVLSLDILHPDTTQNFTNYTCACVKAMHKPLQIALLPLRNDAAAGF